MKKLVIFGAGDIAALAHYYFGHDSEYDVAAFSVDRPFVVENSFCGLPVVPFDELPVKYPPAEFEIFVALSYSRLNVLRKEKYLAAKSQGYRIARYVSSRATVLNDGKIGENCFILEDNTVQPFVDIGDNVTLWSGNHIGHHSIVEAHCFISSHVVISGGVTVGEQTFIGVNATIRDHIKIGARCVIGAGVVLLDDAAPEGVYMATATERSRVPSSRLRRV